MAHMGFHAGLREGRSNSRRKLGVSRSSGCLAGKGVVVQNWASGFRV